MAKTDYTREELIELCEAAVRPEKVWGNRDSEATQIGLGQAWVLLKAGCEFQVLVGKGPGLVTDDETVWIKMESEGFMYFETREEGTKSEHFFYIPTRAKLDRAGEKDWY